MCSDTGGASGAYMPHLPSVSPTLLKWKDLNGSGNSLSINVPVSHFCYDQNGGQMYPHTALCVEARATGRSGALRMRHALFRTRYCCIACLTFN